MEAFLSNVYDLDLGDNMLTVKWEDHDDPTQEPMSVMKSQLAPPVFKKFMTDLHDRLAAE